MHELAIAQSIVDVVEQRASECRATHVKGVRLQIGEASGIFPDSLTFSFEMLAGLSPLLEGARLLIETVPHLAHCQHCAREFVVEQFVPRCPLCAEWSADILSGTELHILEMEIE
ncbi:MAG TPA: hydrogenase maturation nickel metallochaperone HypA [Ktedonobacteraceae bacterium]|jgi:hydrogenase nickel incorporation protein HypA/HybF|nr:hydrogenase maturation nickel metallochaperone HypA [Ktedonobacteraceae bacterium]